MWGDIIAFYKNEKRQQRDLRAINGKWMLKLARELKKHPRFGAMEVSLNGPTLVLNVPGSRRSIYAFCQRAGVITGYLDHCGEALEDFYGGHTEAEIEEAVPMLEGLLAEVVGDNDAVHY